MNRILISCLALLLAGPAAAAARPLHYLGEIVPVPRRADYGAVFSLAGDADGAEGVLIVSDSGSALAAAAARELADRLAALHPPAAGRIRFADRFPDDEGDLALVIGLGQPAADRLATASAARAADGQPLPVPDCPEGYLLLVAPGNRDRRQPALALADACRPRGIFYAAQSLGQLFSLQEGQLSLRAALVSDWPAYRRRISGNDETIPPGDTPREAVDWLARFKLNGWAVGQSYWWPADWRRMPAGKTAALGRAARRAADGRLALMFQVHPFGRADDPDQRHAINISDRDDRETLYRLCRDMLLAGAREIMVRADDFHQLSAADQEYFPDKAGAHAALLNELHRRLAGDFGGDFRLDFCPPYYHGHALDDSGQAAYLERLARLLDPEIGLVWTGPDIISRSFSTATADSYHQALGRAPLLWDNTVFQTENRFGYELRFAWHLFQPFEPAPPEGYHRLSEGIRFNYGFNGTEIARVANIVLADYLWNPEAYEPAASLRRALGLVAGPAAVETLLELAQALQLVFEYAHSPAYILSGPPPPDENRLATLLERLAAQTDNHALRAEMDEQVRNRLAEAREIAAAASLLRRVADRSLLAIGAEDPGWQITTDGKWSATARNGVARFQFPFATRSFAGARAAMERTLVIPASPTGRYYLHFIADDDNRPAGEPPRRWPGYFFRELAVNRNIAWEEDVTDTPAQLVREIDLGDRLCGLSRVRLRLGVRDDRGVHNLGVTASFSRLYLSAYSLEEIAAGDD